MNTKITYTCLNTHSSSTSLRVSTYYDICIELALELLKAEDLPNLTIKKVETV